MCIFCSAIPATAAIGAKLNADQRQKGVYQGVPISRITVITIGLLTITSIVYHTLIWRY
jgi:hypothetical protein